MKIDFLKLKIVLSQISQFVNNIAIGFIQNDYSDHRVYAGYPYSILTQYLFSNY